MEKTNNIIDIEEIQTLIPHRYPFLLVDRVLDYVPGQSIHAIKNVSVNEPVFQGHFPQYKIFPGVMILEAMAQAGGILGFKSVEGGEDEMFLFASVDNARFKAPVVPGDTMHLHLELVKERRGMWKFAGTVKVDGKVVCTADLMCARKGI
ncbi:3-hydroxyacyl-ACP dehydratase FabZ [Thalassotalea ponticola]|uniref:3-hydroxyacyl-ACP dehydratase FabZ n=1 Tax=Thalassotalea ponticola TaxID=1523392 RepID=UPI0025B4B459|nr:3-hydroxyacyl-ACP dehydratase FabZ [Thalassotalea ponticola]MDN3652544.1 3-hydroxyacyl-ACP dehydratase FabZ [Thalassotalea ponticola]